MTHLGGALTQDSFDPATRAESARAASSRPELSVSIFPHVLIRVGGGSFAEFEALSALWSAAIAEAIWRAIGKRGKASEALCDAIYAAVGRQTDGAGRSALVAIKRNVFNGRILQDEEVLLLSSCLYPHASRHLSAYLSAGALLVRLESVGRKVFLQELETCRDRLQSLTRSEPVQKGLLLSSTQLRTSLAHYLEKDPSTFNSRDHDAELGLIKYLSRMYAKTSPFSTFTNLLPAILGSPRAPGVSDPSDMEEIRLTAAPTEIRSHVRLNTRLYGYLQILLTIEPEIRRRIRLRPNPTVLQEANSLRLLSNVDNVEVFQRFEINPILDLFQKITAEAESGIPYRDVVQRVAESMDGSAEEIESFLDELLAYGFLEFNLGVSGIDPDWDLKLMDILRPFSDEVPLARQIVETLTEARRLAKEYERASALDREALLQRLYDMMMSTLRAVHEAAGLPEIERLSMEERRRKNGSRPREAVEEASKKEPRAAEASEKPETARASEKPQAGETSEKPEDAEASQKSERPGATETPFRHTRNTFLNFTQEQMIFEDTTLDGSAVLEPGRFGGVLDPLVELLGEMSRFELQRDEKARMRHFFLEKYGEAAAVDLLMFYEDYYRAVRVPEAAKRAALQNRHGAAAKEAPADAHKHHEDEPNAADPQSVLEDLPEELRARRRRNEKWLAAFRNAVREKNQGMLDEIHFSYEEIRKANNAEGRDVDPRAVSVGCFLQPFLQVDTTGVRTAAAVLNGTFPGFGKLTSRFLHEMDPQVTADTRAWNAKVAPEALLTENQDASCFTANLHPPLMPLEMWLPGGYNSLPAGRQIRTMNVKVRTDPNVEELALIHEPTGRRVYVFDLGFQGSAGRSELFQLLGHFTLPSYRVCQPLLDRINKEFREVQANTTNPPAAVVVLPRIVYSGRLILQRKAWIIEKAFLPVREAAEDLWSYFRRVLGWSLELNLPSDVFVYVRPRDARPTAPQKPPTDGNPERLQPGQHDLKPQYVSFRNPFLVALFAKLVSRASYALQVVEMLPRPAELLPVGDGPRVSEWLFQWYATPRGGGS